ncbi:MAG: hypothetical protein ACOCY7_01300 [Halodesulfurarchaeum sp.]
MVRPRVFVYPLGVWVLMAVVAVANGGFREVVIIPRTGEYTGHVLSTALLITAILTLSFLFFARTSVAYSSVERATIGLVWVVLTVGFEFLIGYLEGTPVSVTLAQYDVFAGRVWIFVPMTLFLAPVVFGRYLASRQV